MNYGFLLSYPGAFVALVLHEFLPLSDVSVFFLSRILQGMLCAFLLLIVLLSADKISGNFFWRQLSAVSIAMLYLTPVAMQQNFAVSADTIVDAFALFVTLLFVCDQINSRFLIGGFFALGCTACITKPPLIALLLPLWWWLRENHRFGSTQWERRFLLAAVLIILTSLTASFISIQVTRPLQGTDPRAQLNFLVQHPIQGLQILSQSAWNIIGNPRGLTLTLGWLDFNPTAETSLLQKTAHRVTLLFFLFPLLAGIRSTKVRFRLFKLREIGSDVIWLAGVWGFVLGVCFFLYLYWSQVGAQGVAGLQMRYFIIPFVLVFAWAGARLDQTMQITYPKAPIPSYLSATGGIVVALCLLAFTVERSFSNFVRYF